MYSTPELRDAWTIRIGEDEHSLKIGDDFLEELYFPERRIPKRRQASHLTAGMDLAFYEAVRYTGSVTCRQTTGMFVILPWAAWIVWFSNATTRSGLVRANSAAVTRAAASSGRLRKSSLRFLSSSYPSASSPSSDGGR